MRADGREPFSFDGQRVLVTGASSGIGAALARELASAGAVVGLCARRADRLASVLDACRASSPESRAWAFDLGDLDAIDDFAVRVDAEMGGIDVLVNNAGQTLDGPALDARWADVERMMYVDYLSPVRLTQAVLPVMLERGSGRVVTVSSMAARMSTPGEAAYAAAKAALSVYFEALAGELWGGPVRFHLVYPALIDVESDRDGDDELAASSDGATPIPTPVAARAIRRSVEAGAFECFIPATMATAVSHRARDVAGSVEFMAGWYAAGGVHGPEVQA